MDLEYILLFHFQDLVCTLNEHLSFEDVCAYLAPPKG